jgi:hypothetical protein
VQLAHDGRAIARAVGRHAADQRVGCRKEADEACAIARELLKQRDELRLVRVAAQLLDLGRNIRDQHEQLCEALAVESDRTIVDLIVMSVAARES